MVCNRIEKGRLDIVRWSLAVVLSSLILNGPAVAAEPQELWISPPFKDAVVQGDPANAAAYRDFFAHPEAWQTVQHATHIVKLYQKAIQFLPDETLRSIFVSLRQNNLKLALEYGLLRVDGACGVGIEGYAGNYVHDAVTKIKRLGGDLQYLALDEPLWFGVEYDGRLACKRSIDDVAADVGRHVRDLRGTFPALKVGDIEPFPRANRSDWIKDIESWLDAYRRINGEPLSFFHADIVWDRAWQPTLGALRASVHQRGIKFGVIYNGSAADTSDAAWAVSALQHAAAVEQTIGRPDQVVIQSWQGYPTKLGPETTPDTFSNIALRYLNRRP